MTHEFQIDDEHEILITISNSIARIENILTFKMALNNLFCKINASSLGLINRKHVYLCST